MCSVVTCRAALRRPQQNTACHRNASLQHAGASIMQYIACISDATTLQLGELTATYPGHVVRTRLRTQPSARVQLQVLYRLTNDMHCNLGAVAEFDDSDADNVVGKFKYYGAIPGLGTAHASVVYDDVSDLFFMVSNLGRNSLQPWDTEMHGPQCAARLLPPFLLAAQCRRCCSKHVSCAASALQPCTSADHLS